MHFIIKARSNTPPLNLRPIWLFEYEVEEQSKTDLTKKEDSGLELKTGTVVSVIYCTCNVYVISIASVGNHSHEHG